MAGHLPLRVQRRPLKHRTAYEGGRCAAGSHAHAYLEPSRQPLTHAQHGESDRHPGMLCCVLAWLMGMSLPGPAYSSDRRSQLLCNTQNKYFCKRMSCPGACLAHGDVAVGVHLLLRLGVRHKAAAVLLRTARRVQG